MQVWIANCLGCAWKTTDCANPWFRAMNSVGVLFVFAEGYEILKHELPACGSHAGSIRVVAESDETLIANHVEDCF
jgi:hypothetical protein